MRWFYILRDTINAYIKDDLFTIGAALAYYAMFSIAPGLFIVLLISGYFVSPEDTGNKVYQELLDVFGEETATMIKGWVDNIHFSPNSPGRTIVTIVTFIFGATAAFSQLLFGLDKIWAIKAVPRSGVLAFFKARMLSLVMLIIIGFLLVASVVYDAVLTIMYKQLSEFGLDINNTYFLVNRLGTFIMTAGLFTWIFKYLPNVVVKFKSALSAGIFTAFLFGLGKWIIGQYLGHSNLGIYGTSTSLIGLLLWIFYTSQIIFIGGEFSKIVQGAFWEDPDLSNLGLKRGEVKETSARK